MLTPIGFFDTFPMPKTKCFHFVILLGAGPGRGAELEAAPRVLTWPNGRRINGS